MSWIKTLFTRIFRTNVDADSIIIDIPAELYYKELAVYTASSLIANAISRSEILCYENNEKVKNKDYFKLNVSPNKNETSSVFWHKVINKVIKNNEALVVEVNDCLYCPDSYSVKDRLPIYGDTYNNVRIGVLSFRKTFTQDNTYLFRLDNESAAELINGMYEEYSKILQSAAKAFRKSHAQKYKIHIDGVKAGDDEFNKEFEEIIKKQLKAYLSNDDAVYPEFDGYDLKKDESLNNNYSADDFLKLKKDLFETVASVYHIPLSMMTGNITNMKEIVSSFLSFAVDPFADMIAEALNKGVGIENFIKGTYYKVNTSALNHRDVFDLATAITNLISSGYNSIDDCKEALGEQPLNTDWSRRHFITKNFDTIENACSSISDEGGEQE